ncbi:hypothetical protein HVPorG_03992 [Roseomonas mucosa]|nr:hypothetical protein HVPorG_03992 [Roseomonas mucosa]
MHQGQDAAADTELLPNSSWEPCPGWAAGCTAIRPCCRGRRMRGG